MHEEKLSSFIAIYVCSIESIFNRSFYKVPGVCVTLCDSVKVPKPPLNVKLDGISLISNIEYNVESLRVWKAYGIGSGKEIQLKELGVPQSA